MAEETAIGRDVRSEQILEESFEAQKLVGGGGAGIYVSLVAKIYRSDRKALNEACQELSRKFGGNLKREGEQSEKVGFSTRAISPSGYAGAIAYADFRLGI